MSIVRFLHLLSLVVWIGGITFFSFIAAPSIFKVLPRETAGEVVGEIFPKYWAIGYICSITALITAVILFLQERTAQWLSPFGIMIGLLVIMIGLTFYSGHVVGAKAREVKAKIRIVEDPAQKEILKAEFKTLHRRSTILNGVILLSGLVVIFLTASTHLPTSTRR